MVRTSREIESRTFYARKVSPVWAYARQNRLLMPVTSNSYFWLCTAITSFALMVSAVSAFTLKEGGAYRLLII